MSALIKAARSEHMPWMLDVLKSADEEEAGRLGMWFVTHPDEEATEIIRKLVAGRYEDRWQLTLSLAGLGDLDTVKWARKSNERPWPSDPRVMWANDAKRFVGYYVVANSPSKDADDMARAFIAKNDQRACMYLVEAYGAADSPSRNANPNRWDRLRDIVNLENKSKDLVATLTETLQQMAGRGDEKAKELLSLLK
jgi:hypothetical protein